ncbi:hypothetical protein ACFV0R_33530, partial [Streptomyces sp. NPDC059578]|uniref:hypothetical protein n=1 Tax=Streptomyces sp. NPDC059578 TaxID=3346874 RepID=UPI0036BC4860
MFGEHGQRVADCAADQTSRRTCSSRGVEATGTDPVGRFGVDPDGGHGTTAVRWSGSPILDVTLTRRTAYPVVRRASWMIFTLRRKGA